MKKNDLKTREDVFNLVSRFYKKVRQNPEIGHFFNEIIQDWDEHLEKLTDFWESHLFGKAIYHGNPKKAHIEVDQRSNGQIATYHFGIWLNMWFETIDELYEGELAERAKTNARKMSTNLFLKMYEARSYTK
jgi:hemoglobin